jgi:hypothetical protein
MEWTLRLVAAGIDWHALHAIDKYLRSQAAWLVNYAKRFRAGEQVGTSITEGTANFLVNRRMMLAAAKIRALPATLAGFEM